MYVRVCAYVFGWVGGVGARLGKSDRLMRNGTFLPEQYHTYISRFSQGLHSDASEHG